MEEAWVVFRAIDLGLALCIAMMVGYRLHQYGKGYHHAERLFWIGMIGLGGGLAYLFGEMIFIDAPVGARSPLLMLPLFLILLALTKPWKRDRGQTYSNRR